VSDVFLGVIAVSVLVMAVIQVAGIILAARAARRVERVVDRVEQGVDKVFAGLHGLTEDAVRAASVFSGILGIFRKSRSPGGKDDKAAGDPDDPMFIG
jgi:hypothetical protein